MFNTIHYILFPYWFHCQVDKRLVGVLSDPYHSLSTQPFKFIFDFGEHELDRVVLRRVRDRPAPFVAHLTHRWKAELIFMGRQIVDKDLDLLACC